MADYTNTRGIFSLLDVRERQGAGVWSTRGDVWATPSPFGKAHPFGYLGGGFPNKSTIDRVDYSNDTATASPRGPLGAAERQAAATSSSSFGYFATSVNPRKSTIQRID